MSRCEPLTLTQNIKHCGSHYDRHNGREITLRDARWIRDRMSVIAIHLWLLSKPV
jgi:hypothetical protein